MAKGYKTKYVATSREADGIRISEYTTSTGITITLRGIPPMEIPRIAQSIEYPKKPTYKVPVAGGGEEIYDHDETTLQTDEDKRAWAKYQEDLKIARDALTNSILTEIMLEGVDFVPDPEEVKRWKRRQQLKGIKLPPDDDSEALLELYKETVLIGNASDMQNIMDIVMELTGVSREVVEQTKKSFPGNVESEPSAGNGNTSGETDGSEGVVGIQLPS